MPTRHPHALEKRLVIAATFVYPYTCFRNDRAVRHARREWVKAQLYLIERGIARKGGAPGWGS